MKIFNPPGISLVQSASHDYLSGHSLAFGSNNVAGNMLIVAWNGSSSVITDTAGNTYQNILAATGNGTNYISVCWHAKGGANTVTVNNNTGNPITVVSEWSGGITNLDQSGSNSGTGTGATWTSNAITTTKGDSLILGLASASFGQVNLNSPFTAISPYIALGDANSYFVLYYEIVSTIQTSLSASGAMLSNAGNNWGAGLVNFYRATAFPNNIICGT